MKPLRYVIRKLARAPLFTTLSILTLGLGIGANVAIFCVIDGVLLKPLPYPQPEQLVGVWHSAPGLGFEEVNQSPATYFTYLEESRVFQDIGLWNETARTVTGLNQPERIETLMVTHRLLPLLGVVPLAGRLFGPDDDRPGSPDTALISYGYWQRAFGGDPGTVGKGLLVNGRSHEIVGILPEGFRFLRYRCELVVPLQFDRADVTVSNFSYQGIARLKPGVTLDAANQDVERMIPLMTEKFPKGISLSMLREARFAPLVRPLEVDLVGNVGDVLWVLLATVAIVLLIACANVANLFLVRAEGRHREFAIRSALGAPRSRIAADLLTETVTLGLLGGLAGLALAYGGIRLLLWIAPSGLPRLEDIGINGQVLLFALAISLLSGVLFGLLPIWKQTRSTIVPALQDGGRGTSEPGGRHRARNLLAVSQIAMALVLLAASGLMIRTFQQILRADPGFRRPEQIQTFRLSIPQAEIPEERSVVRVQQRILDELRTIPGVDAVSMGSAIPMSGDSSADALNVEGFPVPDTQLPPIRRFVWVSPGFFETLGIPLLYGRDFDWGDIENLNSVVVVSENFAREYWDDPREALGKRVRESLDEQWRTIVGVVGNVYHDGVTEAAPKTIYWPSIVANMWGSETFMQRTMAFFVRHQRPDLENLMANARQAVWDVNPNLPLANVRGLDAYAAESRARTSFALVMLGIAAAAALLLAAVGTYGVVSYAASLRTREIGIRMALGAATRDVSRLVLRHGLVLVAAGLVVGLLGAFGLTRLMSNLLFGVAADDPLTYLAVCLALAVIALAAAYLPARRASRVDPMRALRAE